MTTLCEKFEISRANYYRSRQFPNVSNHQNAKSQKNALMKTTCESIPIINDYDKMA